MTQKEINQICNSIFKTECRVTFDPKSSSADLDVFQICTGKQFITPAEILQIGEHFIFLLFIAINNEAIVTIGYTADKNKYREAIKQQKIMLQ